MRAEMPYGIVRLIDRRQPAIFTALPPTAFLLRKNSAGLFDEGKSDDDKEESRRNTCVFQGSMTQSALICAWGPRKVARPCGVRRTHHSGEGCPLEAARLKRRLRPTKKRVCPCQAKILSVYHSRRPRRKVIPPFFPIPAKKRSPVAPLFIAAYASPV